MPETTSRRIAVAHDHPAFAGHGPGQPLLPGVVLLGEVLELLLREAPAALGPRPCVSAVKFLAPVRPGAGLEIRWTILDTELGRALVGAGPGAAALRGLAACAR